MVLISRSCVDSAVLLLYHFPQYVCIIIIIITIVIISFIIIIIIIRLDGSHHWASGVWYSS
jgi:hypothetical protein